MLKHILIPLDGSEAAEAMVPQIEKLLALEVAQVTLLRVVPPSAIALEGLALASLIEQAEAAARLYLEGIRSVLLRDGLVIRVKVAIGEPADTILAVAAQTEVTLITMATHGRSGVGRWLLGSVAERVVRACSAPVLLVRSYVVDGEGAPRLQSAALSFARILVPIDGSRQALGIVPHVVALSKRMMAEVDVVRVIEPGSDHREHSLASEDLQRATAAFAEGDVTVKAHLRHGPAAATLITAAKELDADLIAMKTHGRSGVGRWVLGSVAERVLRRCSLPMLVVRAADAPVNEWSTLVQAEGDDTPTDDAPTAEPPAAG